MKPLIGITVDAAPDSADARTGGVLTLNWNYAQCIADAGGVPVLIPPMADMRAVAEAIHGWLIPGGLDIDPKRFGQPSHPNTVVQPPNRYEGEAELLARLDPDAPVLGICYGCQFLNVARGGTLNQHLPDTVGHESHTGGTLQQYRLEASKLADWLASGSVSGKSYHHQAVDELGEGLAVSARADDGTVEAIEATDRPWMIGVQWHPERTFDDPATRVIFNRFIAAAAAFAEKRTSSVRP